MLLNRQGAEQQRIQYLNVAHFDNATAQAITNEALKYQGWKYVYGGSNSTLSLIVVDLCNGAIPYWKIYGLITS